MAISFKGAHFPPDIMLMSVRWYVAYPLSYRHVEELMEERGVPVGDRIGGCKRKKNGRFLYV
jgi:transposase-like protein